MLSHADTVLGTIHSYIAHIHREGLQQFNTAKSHRISAV